VRSRARRHGPKDDVLWSGPSHRERCGGFFFGTVRRSGEVRRHSRDVLPPRACARRRAGIHAMTLRSRAHDDAAPRVRARDGRSAATENAARPSWLAGLRHRVARYYAGKARAARTGLVLGQQRSVRVLEIERLLDERGKTVAPAPAAIAVRVKRRHERREALRLRRAAIGDREYALRAGGTVAVLRAHEIGPTRARVDRRRVRQRRLQASSIAACRQRDDERRELRKRHR
jgi:hypothetical protein